MSQGCPKSPKNPKTKAGVPAPAPEAIAPLDVMLEIMRRCWAAGDAEGALHAAEKAAPFVHPRLSTSTIVRKDALDSLSESDLQAVVAYGRTRAAEVEAEAGDEAVEAGPDAGPDQGAPPGSPVH